MRLINFHQVIHMEATFLHENFGEYVYSYGEMAILAAIAWCHLR
jgi:hypothetical protein